MVVISTQPVRLARRVTGQELEDLMASLGGREAVRESIQRHGECLARFNSRWDEFAAKHPDHFVALAGDDTVLASETLEGIFGEIDLRGFRRGDCVVKYVSAKPEMWIQ